MDPREPAAHPGTGGPPTGAILTVPNLLTFFRLWLIPLFLWLALGPDQIGPALLVGLVGFATDLVDGAIARRYGQVSRLGILLDPLSDRLALAAGAAVLIVHDLAPLWAVLVIVVRDALLVVVGAPLLRARGASMPPVTPLGKKGSFLVSMCFAVFLASGITGVKDPNGALQVAGWVLFALGAPTYYITAYGYARAGLRPAGRASQARG